MSQDKSEGAEWEAQAVEDFTDEMELCGMTDCLQRCEEKRRLYLAFIAHQRQQAVAEFAREVLCEEDFDDCPMSVCCSSCYQSAVQDRVEKVLKQRGIDLTTP